MLVTLILHLVTAAQKPQLAKNRLRVSLRSCIMSGAKIGTYAKPCSQQSSDAHALR